MSVQNFQQLIDELSNKVQALQSLIDSLNQEKVEEEVAFELKKNDISKEVSSSLRGFDPSGLNMYLPNTLETEINSGDITEILKQTFKI